MRMLSFIGFLGLAAVMLVLPRTASAACVCVCVDGKPKAQCPSVLETANCPASVCANDQRAAPPMTHKENCEVVQGVDPATNRVTRRLVCK